MDNLNNNEVDLVWRMVSYYVCGNPIIYFYQDGDTFGSLSERILNSKEYAEAIRFVKENNLQE